MKIIKLFIYLSIFILLYSCANKSNQQITPDAKIFKPYIAAFPSEYVSRASAIRIILAKELSEIPSTGEPFSIKLFDISPEIKGKTYVIDSRTIEFQPEKKLVSGEMYHVKFHLSKLFDVPKEAKTAEFTFNTVELNCTAHFSTYRPYDKKDLTWNKISGTFHSSDYLEQREVEEIIKAKQDNQNKPMTILTSGNNNRSFDFEIDSVRRREEKASVNLSWNGTSLGYKLKGSENYEIPALGDFHINKTHVIHHPQQALQIIFSDPLDDNQLLDGFVQLGENNSLHYEIDYNILNIYPAVRQSGTQTVTIFPGIKNILGYKISEEQKVEVIFEAVKPALRLINKGVIVPQSDDILFPFESVNLNAIDVRIIQIYEENILQFLQVNQLDQQYQLRRVGRLIHKESINLISDNPLDYGKWNSFSLDLSELISPEPGAIYRIELSFKPQYSMYPCDEPLTENDMHADKNFEQELAYWDNPNAYNYDYEHYNWNERNNPCNKAYFGKRRNVSRNIFASNLGIIAKATSGGNYHVVVNDIRTSDPISNAFIELYNYQQQLIGSGSTDGNGFINITPDGVPYSLVANHNNNKGYLRLADGHSLSVSKFDVSGSDVQKGMKGFIYAERGVWRPGDSIYLNFILKDKLNNLPDNHPVIFELKNPQNQLTDRQVQAKSLKGFYNFSTKTPDDGMTGTWSANVRIGNTHFHKSLNIQTIKPNRLKINLKIDEDYLLKGKPVSATLHSEWLHGAPARNLKADMTVAFSNKAFSPEGYNEYTFSDPSRKFYTEESTVFDGKLNENGNREVSVSTAPSGNPPSALLANFTTRVFEEGGEFSIDRYSIPYYSYPSFTGIDVPEGNKWGWLLTDTSHTVKVVTLNPNGVPVSRNRLDIKIYKINWRWWWDSSDDNLASYVQGSYRSVVYQDEISTVNGKGSFSFKINKPEWGRYFIRVYDPVSGHSSGKVIYVDWPYGSNRDRNNPEAASMLTFSSDKEKYQPGETAIITIPKAANGRALISIENGSDILEKFWYDVQSGEQKIPIDITPKMAPNIYVHITFIQPHHQTSNDLPIRLYGVKPVFVEDPATVLHPELTTDKTFRPETPAIISVNEKTGKEMAYTLAIVDEGLLDLTRFQTPNPHQVFYAREALGIKTWDLYDHVLGAYGGKIEQIFSVGGDGDFEFETEPKKANRFKPMVKFIGPVLLKPGKTNTHTIHIPRYIGSVRVMLIAGNENAYGSTDKTVPVKNELMVLATLPRVVGPGEQVQMPATVFAMDENLNQVTVKAHTNDLFTIEGAATKKLVFSQSGDQLVNFKLKVADKSGIGKAGVNVSSGSYNSTDDIEIEVRNPNPPIFQFHDKILQPGEMWKYQYTLPGMEGTNAAVLELSTIPSVDFGRRLKYLLQYPHGCLEQIVSGSFPQLFLPLIMNADENMLGVIDRNVREGIRSVQKFVHPDGGFAYWPNSNESNSWVTSYTGHFLIEAEKQGYVLPHNMLKNWTNFQKRMARNWSAGGKRYRYERYFESDLQQAYRLYTLALANKAETGSMNRLREKDDLAVQARWLLASSYALINKNDIANDLVRNLGTEVPEYQGSSFTYGSTLRDRAIVLLSLQLLDRQDEAINLMKNIAEVMSSGRWLSTQSVAFGLMSVAQMAGDAFVSDEMKFEYQVNNGKTIRGHTEMPVHQIDLNTSSQRETINVTNNGESVMFAQLSMSGIPFIDSTGSIQSNLRMNVEYNSLSNKFLNVDQLEQGTDFKAVITIENPTNERYHDMALTHIVPSGWEIVNMRLNTDGSVHYADIPQYQDIRDDRVYMYFDLGPGKSKQFVILLNASYKGKFFLPAVSCEAMYNNRIRAKTTGKWVEVK